MANTAFIHAEPMLCLACPCYFAPDCPLALALSSFYFTQGRIDSGFSPIPPPLQPLQLFNLLTRTVFALSSFFFLSFFFIFFPWSRCERANTPARVFDVCARKPLLSVPRLTSTALLDDTYTCDLPRLLITSSHTRVCGLTGSAITSAVTAARVSPGSPGPGSDPAKSAFCIEKRRRRRKAEPVAS